MQLSFYFKQRNHAGYTLLILCSSQELNRFPSPPPLRMSSPEMERDTESARQRRKEESELAFYDQKDTETGSSGGDWVTLGVTAHFPFLNI